MNKRILMSVSLAIALFSVSASAHHAKLSKVVILMMPRSAVGTATIKEQGRAFKIHLELTA